MTEQRLRRYHVLAAAPDEEIDFYVELEDSLRELASEQKRDLRFVETFHPKSWQEINVYRTADEQLLLVVVEDYDINVRYLLLEGPQQLVSRAGKFLAERLCARSLAEWQDLAAKRMDDEPATLVKLALAAGEQADDETKRLITEGLNSTDRAVRLKAVEAASVSQWPTFATLLAKAYESDPDADVRRTAGEGLTLLVSNPRTD